MANHEAIKEVAARLVKVRSGLFLHQCVYVAAELGLADCIAAGIGSVRALAAATQTNEDALHRVLRLLAGEGLFVETTPGVFSNTPTSELLRGDVPGSMKALFSLLGGDFGYPCFGEMLYSVRTGEPSRTKLSGMDSFAYLREHPAMARTFDDAMTAIAEAFSPGVAAAYDFGRFTSLMDVGGGNGVLLGTILRAYPKLHGVLADQEHVLARARQRPYLGAAVGDRVTMAPCNFFEEVPRGAQAYMMSRVIHDWNDEQSIAILSNCRRAVPEHGVLLLVESALAGPNQPSPGRFIDVAMLVLTGGRERTVEQYAALFQQSGFRLGTVTEAAGSYLVLEAHPA